MPRFLSLLLIFLINVEIDAEYVITFNDIDTAVNWGIKKYKNEEFSTPEHVRSNVEGLLRDVNKVSTTLDKLDLKMDIKLDRMLNILLDDLEVTAGLEQSQIQLCEYINRVDDFFDNAMIYQHNSSYGGETLQQFFNSALWCHDNLPNLLENIYDLFVPGVESRGMLLMMRDRGVRHINHDCDDSTSVQQTMYYTYVQAVLAEMKGLLVLEHIYATQLLINQSSHNYAGELAYMHKQYSHRLRKYHEIFLHNLAVLPQQIRRCDIYSPQYNKNYIEMEQFTRATFLDTQFQKENGCETCPDSAALEKLSRIRGTHVYNCNAIGGHATICRTAGGTSHDYKWWRTDDKTYGREEPCAETLRIAAESECQLCICSEDRNNGIDIIEYHVMKISALEKYSDIENDKVVTGIRFVTENKLLHLQVQQAKFSSSGIAESESEWAPINPKTEERHFSRNPRFYPLSSSLKTIHLDDIKTPVGYVVTGVKFATVGEPPVAIELRVHATEFDFGTGKLKPESGVWVTAFDHQLKPDDYKRPRLNIDMGRSDDPRRTEVFEYDVTTNKKITFTHTDIEFDCGQTTIPLIDAQSVETHPPFPLGGVGLSYRGRKLRGGYIALRLFTVNVTEHMKMPRLAVATKIV